MFSVIRNLNISSLLSQEPPPSFGKQFKKRFVGQYCQGEILRRVSLRSAVAAFLTRRMEIRMEMETEKGLAPVHGIKNL